LLFTSPCVRVGALGFVVMQLVLCFYVARLSKVLKVFSLGLHTHSTSDRMSVVSPSSSGFCKLGLLMVHDQQQLSDKIMSVYMCVVVP